MILARTLATLVSAKVEGVIGDVRLAGPAGQDLFTLAHHAGCELIEAKTEAAWLSQAIRAAHGPDLFLLAGGRAPEPGFIDEARDFLAADGGARPRTACLRAVPEHFFERLFPSIAPMAGLIAPRDLLLAAPAGGFAALARFVAPKTLFRAKARRVF